MKHALVIITTYGVGVGSGYYLAVLGIKKLLDSGELIRRR